MHLESIALRLQAIESQLALVLNWLSFMTQKETAIMATIQEFEAAVTAVVDKVTALLTTIATENNEVAVTIQRLIDQIAAGTPVSQAQLDGLMSTIVAVGTGLDTANTAVAGFVPTPV